MKVGTETERHATVNGSSACAIPEEERTSDELVLREVVRLGAANNHFSIVQSLGTICCSAKGFF